MVFREPVAVLAPLVLLLEVFMKVRRLSDEDMAIGGGSVASPSVYTMPDFAQAAEAIIDETNADDQLPAIEKAARLAGAALLMLIQQEELEGKPAFDFLKNLFEKKTPAPVQRIEQRTHADFRVIFEKAFQNNPNVLEESLARAEQVQLAIRERLSLPPSLELTPKVADEAEFEKDALEPSVETPVNWKPGQEPAEITSIRREVQNEPVSDRHRRFIEELQG